MASEANNETATESFSNTSEKESEDLEFWKSSYYRLWEETERLEAELKAAKGH